MGINICLFKDGEDHPDWDDFRRGNDENFPSLVNWDSIVLGGMHKFPELHEDNWRPTDLPELRQRIINTGWEDADRYLYLVGLLESDSECYLYFSY